MSKKSKSLKGYAYVVLIDGEQRRAISPDEAQSMLDSGRARIVRNGVIQSVPTKQAPRRGILRYKYRSRSGIREIQYPVTILKETYSKYLVATEQRIIRPTGDLFEPGDEIYMWKELIKVVEPNGGEKQ